MKEISLTKGYVALVDDRDYDVLMRLAPWHAHKAPRTFYAVHSYYDGGGREAPRIRKLLMHHVIMGRKFGGRDVDHKDGNGLNNQRSNLRWSTRSQNRANSAKARNGANKYKGVHFLTRLGKFQAYIGSKPKRYLGVFRSEEEAASAYDRAAIDLYGEFACLNLPQAK
ncbi:HNH endonuclease [Terracidiphilus gabretensis]|uniref:HNH endonuclease n=1 Tax=Terracidiphilus gabretensis TaxID=1577687 RepID=UPI00071B6338|nr:HNH endonuclease [Terracidiphilus gabretensis]